MTVLNTAQAIAVSMAIGLAFSALASAQVATDEAKQSDKATESKREEPALPKATEYVNLPEVIAIGKRWRLDDDVREALWRNQLRQEERNLQEREYRDRFSDGAVGTKTSSGGRFKAEFLPYYDPQNAKVIDMGVDQSRSEVVELFRGSF